MTIIIKEQREKMKYLAIPLIAFSVCIKIYAEDYKVTNMDGGAVIPSIVIESRGVYSFSAEKMGGIACGILMYPPDKNQTSEIYAMSKKGILVVGCTKIKPEKPQDDGLIEDEIVSEFDRRRTIGGKYYRAERKIEDNKLIAWEMNMAYKLSRMKDLTKVIRWNGFESNETGQIRIDRHFVKDGYYIQVVTVCYTKDENGAFAEILNNEISKEIIDSKN